MRISCLKFISENVSYEKVTGKSVLEVGSRDFNGSPKYILGLLNPGEYVGVDMEEGPGVDIICKVEELVNRFGENRFDIVVSTEMLEHVFDWQIAVSNLKRILKPGGVLLITTRSFGFPYHSYPYDYWRYELEDFQNIFSDMEIVKLEKDPTSPGVFLKAVKPKGFTENCLADINLFQIVLERKVGSLSLNDINTRDFQSKREKFLKRDKRRMFTKQIINRVTHFLNL